MGLLSALLEVTLAYLHSRAELLRLVSHVVSILHLNAKLRPRVSRLEIFRVGRAKPRIHKVCRAARHRRFALVQNAPLGGLVVHLHELDDAFGRVGQTLLALHYALQLFFLQSAVRLLVFLVRLGSALLRNVRFTASHLERGLSPSLRNRPRRGNRRLLRVDVVSTMLPEQSLRGLQRSR